MRQFRAVVIDDDAEVLRRIAGRISTVKREFEGETWLVDLSIVSITLAQDASKKYIFSESTISDLAAAFSVRPDIVLMDYGYIEAPVLRYWVERGQDGHQITANDLAGQFLTPIELTVAVRAAIEDSRLDSAVRKHLRDHFLEYDGPLVLYTMTSTAFLRALGEIGERRARVDAAFPRAQVRAVDTKGELYNGDEFAGQKHETAFYAHLVGGLMDKQLQIGLLEKMLTEARGLKYLQYRRSAFAAGAIIAVGGGVAAVAEFLGSRIGEFMRAGDHGNALILAGLALVVVFLVGLLLPLAFGSFMSGLLERRGEAPSR